MAVAQHRSFSRASQVMYLSQPAISKHIRLLEEHYATKLFDRKGIQVELTAAGKLLFERLLEMRKLQEQTEHELSALQNRQQAKGVLKLGASTTAALYVLPKVLSAFNQLYPQTDISLLNRNAEIVLDALLNEEIDLGIIEGRGKRSQLDYEPFITDEVIAVCRRKSPLAKKRTYPLSDIHTMPLAVRERGSGTLAAVKFALEKNNIKLSNLLIKVRLGGTEALKNFLLESDSLGFLPEISVQKELASGELVQLYFDGFSIQRNFYFIQRKGESSELNRRFIVLAKNRYNL